MKKEEPIIFNMNENEIEEKIQEYLPVKTKEKELFGEVFTPISVINEMFDKLDEIYIKYNKKSIFSESLFKWLDPACGTGNYMMILFNRLMIGLKNKISNITHRKNHIIKNMIYMIELNKNNYNIAKKIFGINSNIACADFINEKDKWIKQFNNNNQFNIIIGNPPYNAHGVGNIGQKHLDDLFIIKSFELLKDKNSYLSFITKTHWRSFNSGVVSLLNNKTLEYIKTYDFNNNPFKENVLTNYFIIKNNKTNNKTIFEFNNIITKGNLINNMNIYFLYRNYLSILKNLTYKYGSLENITRTKKENGNEYLLLRHSTPEVLIKKQAPVDDKYYIITNPNKLMKFFFNSDIYKDMRQIGRFTGFTTSKDLFYDIPNFNNINNKEEISKIKKILEQINSKLKIINNKTKKSISTNNKTKKIKK
jgi:hypothetical protein